MMLQIKKEVLQLDYTGLQIKTFLLKIILERYYVCYIQFFIQFQEIVLKLPQHVRFFSNLN